MKLIIIVFLLNAWLQTPTAKTEYLPSGFVNVTTIDPTIRFHLRYLTDQNLLGTRIDGYHHSNLILTYEAANALKCAQKLFNIDGMSIMVYDAYRPTSAVAHFARWAKNQSDVKMKDQYYPRVDKSKLFDLGYIANKSGHSRGSTIDMSIIPIKDSLHPIKPFNRTLSDGSTILILDDGTLDFGGSWDLMDEVSHYGTDFTDLEYAIRRKYMRGVMEKCGFEHYPYEWWHFGLRDEPFPDTYFDFPVE
eukprot:TRINITY_DN10795_c0_g1_i1.p1 TRINITY_DN10795_c0_g1~~TRINITY_DN10795_c0_g1_i1.p1  ORF type:complete len:262 (-),score=41.21 TRINITY_DN10795_c0_g1_i1:176-919(-)